jgi:hypothetical protein
VKRIRIIAIFAFLPSVFFVRSAFGAGGSDAGNGGGIAEKRLIFVYQNFEKYLDSCLLTSFCRLDEKEMHLLKDIRSGLIGERKTPQQIEFLSGKSQPDSFKIDGQVRIAKTGNEIGSKIYVNTDLLYWSSADGKVQSIDIPSSVSILAHEFGHHHGVKDHTFLDELGSKIQAFVLKQTEQSSIWNGDVQFTIIQNNIVRLDEDKKRLHDVDQVLIAYGEQLVDLTGKMLAAMRCPHKSESIKGLHIYNLHEERGIKLDNKVRIDRKPLRAWYILSCRTGEESDHGDLQISLGLRRDLKTKEPDFLLEESTFQQESCLKNPLTCK